MRIKETKVYPFDELSENAQEKAIENLYDINISHDWWDSVFDDATSARLVLTEFDIGRENYCRGVFIESAEDTAVAIIENHGETCETCKTAIEYHAESEQLLKLFPEKPDEDDYDENEGYRAEKQEELDNEFLHDILEDYRIILQKEYGYLAGSNAIVETIKANKYEFTENGVLV